jgi:aralkylamine N-acetyltransferase
MKREAVEIRCGNHGVNWPDVEGLFALAGLNGRTGDKVQRAFESSQVVCYAYAASRLVGVGRALTDWEYHAFIYDVAVHPDFQKQGIGRLIMQSILDRVPVWRVMLIASPDVQPFYAKFDFAEHTDVRARLNWSKLADHPE